MRVAIQPELIRWALERAALDSEKVEKLKRRFPKFSDWEQGTVRPTLRQIEKFAKAVHAPVGYLFLSKPPKESLPIPDFRTLGSHQPERPSPNLLDTIYACQERQNWYHDFARRTRQSVRDFVGSVTLVMKPEPVAADMHEKLAFKMAEHLKCRTWIEALRLFIKKVDEAGVMVMVSSVVLNNPHRRLDTQEFRGFALSDQYAPLVFINGADSKSAQMFTLAHELAHLWLDRSALSNTSASSSTESRREETWCNAVAAEFLVPMSNLLTMLGDDESPTDAMSRLSQHFKVSRLVILRRLLDAKWLDLETFVSTLKNEQKQLSKQARKKGGGGDFYRTLVARVSHRFVRAVIPSTLEGETLFRDAFHMLGITGTKSFQKLAARE